MQSAQELGDKFFLNTFLKMQNEFLKNPIRFLSAKLYLE